MHNYIVYNATYDSSIYLRLYDVKIQGTRDSQVHSYTSRHSLAHATKWHVIFIDPICIHNTTNTSIWPMQTWAGTFLLICFPSSKLWITTVKWHAETCTQLSNLITVLIKVISMDGTTTTVYANGVIKQKMEQCKC